jgi:hypothetical protein
MRTLSNAFKEKSQSDSLEPIFVAKILNDNKTIYLTSAQVGIVDPGASIFQECVISSSGSSQKITPERGLSTVGDVTIVFQDNGFTDLLREIKYAYSDTINNNKVEMYSGYKGMDFADFVKVIPLWVASISNTETEFTLSLADTNRLVKKSIFEPKAKTIGITSLRLTDASTSSPLTLTVESTAGFERVQHNAGWEYQPNMTVGYIKVTGVNQKGESAKEILCYDAKTANSFNIIKRQCFGTSIIDFIGLNGTDSTGSNSNEIEIEECVYLDLPVPYMAIAILTGELYGQVGQRIPAHWAVGVDQALINIDSFAEIGGDLLGQRLQFIDLDKEESKEFINQQILSPFGLMTYVDQEGELFCRRYSFLSQFSSGGKVLGYDQITNSPTISRNFKSIRNRFIINWEWRPDLDYYARKDAYLDLVSKNTFNIESDTYSINLRGIKNTDKNSKPAIDFVAQSIASRMSNPSIVFSIQCFLGDVIDLEVGDTVTLDLPNHPDYDSLDTLLATFEVQGISWDFIRQSASLDLFASAGKATQFDVNSGSDVASINHTGWTNLASRSDLCEFNGGEAWFKNGASIPAGKWYYNGNIVFKSGRRVYINQSVFLDANNGDITAEPDAIIDGKGRGVVGAKGYVGGADAGQNGVTFDLYGAFNAFRRYASRIRDSSYNIEESNDSAKIPFIIKSNDINASLPPLLYGSGGGRGMVGKDFDGDVYNGGAPVAGGAGLFLSCNNFFPSASSVFDLSGSDSNVGSKTFTGSSGFGYPGAMIVAIKKRSSPLPVLGSYAKLYSGSFIEGYIDPSFGIVRPNPSGSWNYNLKNNRARPPLPAARLNGGLDYSNAYFRAIRLVELSNHEPEAGVDNVSNAIAPIMSLKENINTPKTPNGNISTITVNASAAPLDTGYSYTLFEYRNKALNQWIPITYKTSGEATVEVVSDGTTYQFRGTSYNKQGISGGVSIAEIKVSNVNKDTDTSDGGSPSAPDAIKVPNIKRLELVNRITEDDWDKFKSGNAEFRWAKLSNTLGGSIIQLNGTTDLHLQGYNIRIKNVSGKILREEQVRDSFYTYTYDENVKDTGGNPVRKFKFEVQAVATTGHVSAWNGFEVENPAPSAVTGVVTEQVKDGVFITYTPPSDVDFVGVKIRGKLYTGSSITIPPATVRSEVLTIVSVDQFGDGLGASVTIANPAPAAPTGIQAESSFTSITVRFNPNQDDFDFIGTKAELRVVGGAYGSPIILTSNTYSRENLDQNTSYEVRLTSIDTLGEGGSTTAIIATKDLNAADVTGLGAWATVGEANAAFIAANVANDAIPSQKIGSIVAGKIETGTLAANVQITAGTAANGVQLNAAGFIEASNGGTFKTRIGAHSIGGTTYVLSAADGALVNFAVLPNGSGKFGQLTLGANGSITSPNFSIAANGDAFFSGTLAADIITANQILAGSTRYVDTKTQNSSLNTDGSVTVDTGSNINRFETFIVDISVTCISGGIVYSGASAPADRRKITTEVDYRLGTDATGVGSGFGSIATRSVTYDDGVARNIYLPGDTVWAGSFKKTLAMDGLRSMRFDVKLAAGTSITRLSGTNFEIRVSVEISYI